MLRQRKPLEPDILSRLQTLCNYLLKSSKSWDGYWHQHTLFDEARELVCEYLKMYNVIPNSVILHQLGEANKHTDSLCKNVFVMVIKGDESALLYEDDRSDRSPKPLLTGSVFTINDHNEHGIDQLESDEDSDLAELWLITAGNEKY